MVKTTATIDVPDFQNVKKSAWNRARREGVKRAITEVMLGKSSNNRIRKRFEGGQIERDLKWQRRNAAYKEVKKQIRRTTASHLWSGRARKDATSSAEAFVLGKKKAGVKMTIDNPAYGRRKPGKPDLKREIQRWSPAELEEIAKQTEKHAAEILNDANSRFRRKRTL